MFIKKFLKALFILMPQRLFRLFESFQFFRLLRGFIVGIVLLVFYPIDDGKAFTLITGRGWPKSDVYVHYNWESCPESLRGNLKRALSEAVDIWSSIPTSNLRLRVGDSVNVSAEEADIARSGYFPIVVCNNNFEGNKEEGRSENYTPAYARVTNNRISNFIAYAVVVLNTTAGGKASLTATYPSGTPVFSYDKILVILTHELGHTIGLGHTGSQESIMYFSSSYREKANLSMDDVRGVTYLYNRDEMFFEDSFLGACGQSLWMPSLKVFPRKVSNGANILFLFIPLLFLFGLVVVGILPSHRHGYGSP